VEAALDAGFYGVDTDILESNLSFHLQTDYEANVAKIIEKAKVSACLFCGKLIPTDNRSRSADVNDNPVKNAFAPAAGDGNKGNILRLYRLAHHHVRTFKVQFYAVYPCRSDVGHGSPSFAAFAGSFDHLDRYRLGGGCRIASREGRCKE
jgi:hypothetical protein